jgi:hypothetical protein
MIEMRCSASKTWTGYAIRSKVKWHVPNQQRKCTIQASFAEPELEDNRSCHQDIQCTFASRRCDNETILEHWRGGVQLQYRSVHVIVQYAFRRIAFAMILRLFHQSESGKSFPSKKYQRMGCSKIYHGTKNLTKSTVTGTDSRGAHVCFSKGSESIGDFGGG